MGTWTMKGWGAEILREAPHSSGLLMASVSISALVLPPVALIAAALGAWRFGADPGWTGDFFIKRGLLLAIPSVVRTRHRRANNRLLRQSLAIDAQLGVDNGRAPRRIPD